MTIDDTNLSACIDGEWPPGEGAHVESAIRESDATVGRTDANDDARSD